MENKPNINIVCYSNIYPNLKKKYNFDKNYLKLCLHGKTSNVNIANDYYDYASVLTGRLSSKTKDLLDIATTVYLADRYIEDDEFGIRNLNILIPVREKQLWEKNKDILEKLIEFLIRCNVNFYFEEKEDDEEYIKSENTQSFDSVVCFSGGLDSFVGAIRVFKNNHNPILVSHSTNNILTNIQNDAQKALEKYLKHKVNLCRINVSSRKSSKKGRRNEHFKGYNPNQLCRSFLFLSLATAVAYELNISKIFMCENGILSVNLPITEARFNTRTAHPKVLYLFQELINIVFEKKIILSNPFLYKTKSEILRELDVDKVECINKTVSCWNYNTVKRYKKKKQCGYCYPCIIRRISINHAFPFDTEKDDEYLINIFNEYPFNDNDKTVRLESLFNVNDLINFSSNLINQNEYEIQSRYPELYIDIKDIDSNCLVEMYLRFSKEVISVFKEKGNDLIREFIKSTNNI